MLRFASPQKALKTKLPAGTYRAYPNLKPGQQEASVSLQIRPGGASLQGFGPGNYSDAQGDYSGEWESITASQLADGSARRTKVPGSSVKFEGQSKWVDQKMHTGGPTLTARPPG